MPEREVALLADRLGVGAMSLYWHFVDMAWMFILPLLYLAGPHTASQAVEQFKEAIGMATGSH